MDPFPGGQWALRGSRQGAGVARFEPDHAYGLIHSGRRAAARASGNGHGRSICADGMGLTAVGQEQEDAKRCKASAAQTATKRQSYPPRAVAALATGNDDTTEF